MNFNIKSMTSTASSTLLHLIGKWEGRYELENGMVDELENGRVDSKASIKLIMHNVDPMPT